MIRLPRRDSLEWRRAEAAARAVLARDPRRLPPVRESRASDDERIALGRLHRYDPQGRPSDLWRREPLAHMNRAALATLPAARRIPMDLDAARELLRRECPLASYVVEQGTLDERGDEDLACELGLARQTIAYHRRRGLVMLAVWTGAGAERPPTPEGG